MAKIFFTGGAGYVGAVLTPKLLAAGHQVKVYDQLLYGDAKLEQHPRLELVVGDIRDTDRVAREIEGCDTVLHFACISNDPSFELDPNLSKTINFDCFEPMVKNAKRLGVKRFIYASSSSVYGVSESSNVNEEHPLHPLTDYSKYKALCEPILLEEANEEFVTTVIRPATVCGYSPRLRLDLSVNILTNHAVHNRKILVFGGAQKRPNIHIEDLSDLYVQLVTEPKERIQRKIYNAGYENFSILELATMVKEVVEKEFPEGKPIELEITSTDDPRSYHINSDKIAHELGFIPKRDLRHAVKTLCEAFRAGKIPDSFSDASYFNVKVLRENGFR